MADINRWGKDRLALAYEGRIINAVYGRNGEISGEVKSIIEYLADEFDKLMGLSAEENKEVTKSAFSNVRINGGQKAFLKEDSWQNDRAARAYAMLKIKETLLYSKNSNTVDGKNHIVIKRGDNWEAVEERSQAAREPVKPKEPSGFKKFMNKTFNGYSEEIEKYNRELAKYNREVSEYERSLATKRYDELWIREAESTQSHSKGNVVKRSLQELRANGELDKRIKEADTRTHINSKEYKAFLTALKNVNDKWDEENRQENAKDMISAYNRLEKACNDYIGRNSSPSSDMGKKRLEIVRNVLDAMKEERQSVEVLWDEADNSESFERLGDIATNARSLNVDNGNYKKKKIGAATSSRTLVETSDKKFVFTEDSEKRNYSPEEIALYIMNKHNLSEDFKNKFINGMVGSFISEELMKLSDPEGIRKFFREKGMSAGEDKEKWDRFADDLFAEIKDVKQKGGGTRDILNFVKGYDLYGSADENGSKGYRDGKALFERYLEGTLFLENTIMGKQSIDDKIRFLKKSGFEDTDSKNVRDFLTEAGAAINGHYVAGKAGIDRYRRWALNERNVATSEIASLLGCPDAVAKSVRAKFENKNGVAMDFAEGESYKYFIGDKADEIRENTMAEENGYLKKKIADLQILDCICGQIDRHMGNVIFTVDDKTRSVTDIKGIDNDMSFGLQGVRNHGYHSIEMGLIRVVDKDTLNSINAISKEVLDYRLKDLLSEDEIDALWGRVNVVKDWLNSDKVTKLSGEEWNKKSWSELSAGAESGYNIEKKRNLFFKAGKHILPRGYEYNKRNVKNMVDEGNDFVKGIQENQMNRNENVNEIGGNGGRAK